MVSFLSQIVWMTSVNAKSMLRVGIVTNATVVLLDWTKIIHKGVLHVGALGFLQIAL